MWRETKLRNQNIYRNEWLLWASLTVQVMSTFLVRLDYYDELNSKYTRILATIYRRANLLDLVTKYALTKAVDGVRNKVGPSCEILQIPLKRMLLCREGEQMRIFSFLYIVGSREYRLLYITVVPRADGKGRYLVPQMNVQTITIGNDPESYFEGVRTSSHRVTGLEKSFYVHPKSLQLINTILECLFETICLRYPPSGNRITWKELMVSNSCMLPTELQRSP